MQKYQILVGILIASGSQLWEVEADSPEDALSKYNRGEGDVRDEVIDVTSLAEVTLRDVSMADAVEQYEPRLKDHELMLWLYITGNGRWEANTKELCFDGMRYSCIVDLVGLPELSDHTRARLRDFYHRMKSE